MHFVRLNHRNALTAALLACSALLPLSGRADILTTRHNLSSSGPGEPGVTRSTDQTQVCIFCHVPHHSQTTAPLWSREDPDPSGTGYTPYSSSTMEVQPGQPRGGSRLCLSCHDGTIAMGMLAGGRQVSTLDRIPDGSRSNLTRDLSDDHPISLSYTSEMAIADGELALPSEIDPILKLESREFLECRTCHDPHKNTSGKFLVMSFNDGALCKACHRKNGWEEATHALAPELGRGCSHCHLPHTARGERLTRRQEENTCFLCHGADGPASNVQSSLGNFSRHPVDSQATAGIHNPAEDPLNADPHVECTDCHNPHAANDGAPSMEGGIAGPLRGVKGVDSVAGVVDPANFTYEVCFRCHAQNSFIQSTVISRQIEEVDQSSRFDIANPSFHPVLGARNAGIPGLRSDYTSNSIITCTDCHGNSEGTRMGGTEANGPHGSAYPPLLIAQYEQGRPPMAYYQGNYELCFRCHDPAALFDGGTSGFVDQHQNHIIDQGVPCSACHDPHGVPWALGGNLTANAHLINFDIEVVDPLTASYDSGARSCTVSCHISNPRGY